MNIEQHAIQAHNSSSIRFGNLISQVIDWADDKQILKQENSLAQMAKITEEVGEVASALLKKNQAKLIDGIGDAFVTLIVLSLQNNLDPTECLNAAYQEIKNRKGKTVDGTFIKDESSN